MALSGNLGTEERLVWLRSQLDRHGSVRIVGAAAELGVSEMTIRRDLLELEHLGMARRIRGGAIAVQAVSFEGRHALHRAAKARIAAKARRLVPGSGAIGIDASSTLVRLAGAIDRAHDLLVVTNGEEAFATLQDTPGLTPLLTGGVRDARTGGLVGPTACAAAGSLLLTRLFLSAAALDPVAGASETTVEGAEVKRAMVAVASHVVLCLDASKLGTRAIAPTVGLDAVDVLVTDLDPGDRRLEPYRGEVELL